MSKNLQNVKFSIHVKYFSDMYKLNGRTPRTGNYICDEYTIERVENIKKKKKRQNEVENKNVHAVYLVNSQNTNYIIIKI